MKKLLACAVAVLCVVSIAGFSFAGGEEAPVKAVETKAVECGHDDGTCGGQGCCHVHSQSSSHGQAMEQQCGVCGKNHGTTLFDGACFCHNVGCAWKQTNNAGETAVCCVLGFFKDAGRLWGLLGSGASSQPAATSDVPVTVGATAETK